MKLIKPAEISSKIMTLIDEADKELIIISPYNDLDGWVKLHKYFKQAIARGIDITYYARKGVNHKGLEEIGVNPILVDNLHAKIYMNEKYGIVTSMNLVRYSDNFSLDIGYMIDDKDELDDLHNYIDRYISIYNDSVSSKKEKYTISKHIENEVILYDYFEMYLGEQDIEKFNFTKNYFPNTAFIESCGYYYKKNKVGCWLYFDKNGFLVKEDLYDNGKITESRDITYDEDISLYSIIVSLANLVSGIYKISIKDLYFKGYIKNYVSNYQKSCLYDHLQKFLNINFHDTGHVTFQDLADDIKWYLKGNKTNCPYKSYNIF